MIQTEEQRRWWFATHPEFRSSHKEGRNRREPKEEEESKKYSPEEVDAYVDEQLKYTTGREAELLKIVKRVAGTEGATRGPERESRNAEGDTETRGIEERPGPHRPGLSEFDADNRLILAGYYPADTAPGLRLPTLQELPRLPHDMIIRFFRWLDALWRNNQLAVDPDGLERHHMRPEEFIDYFWKCGLRIEDAVKILRAAHHRLKKFGGLHTGKGRGGAWNQEWREFIMDHPPKNTPGRQDQIRQKEIEMNRKYGIDEKAILSPPIPKRR